MSDALRIDLTLARAAGLPLRSANDASVPRESDAVTVAASTDAMFSPLALLLLRFLPPQGTPAPKPTSEEAHLLLAYLQQRVVAVLQAAGVAVPAGMRVSVDADGVLHLVPAPAEREHAASLLRQDADVTRLAEVLRRPGPGMAVPDTMPRDDAVAMQASVSLASGPALRRVWPWQWFADAPMEDRAPNAPRIATPLVEAALGLGFVAALLLAAWLLS